MCEKNRFQYSSLQACFSPIIVLITDASSLLHPIEFRRSQTFYISSNITLECNGSLATMIEWTICKCDSNCSVRISIDKTLVTTLSEIVIPAKTLEYGVYQLKLTVAMSISPKLTASADAYVRIIPSGITANLVQFGTSMITQSHQQDLVLDPGSYSNDLDHTIFNISVRFDSSSFQLTFSLARIGNMNTTVEYMVSLISRIFKECYYPSIAHELIRTIHHVFLINQVKPFCLTSHNKGYAHAGNETPWQYGGTIASPKSRVTILGGSLRSNRTYQFMVLMESFQNSSLRATGYSLVAVNDGHPPLLVIQ